MTRPRRQRGRGLRALRELGQELERVVVIVAQHAADRFIGAAAEKLGDVAASLGSFIDDKLPGGRGRR